ncbi:MAG: hypothetical protein Q9191_004845 [Dirinaria sp. TL-2023a]
MMGIPNFRLRLPSRNWLIFLSVTGSFATALFYDKYHKRRAQQKWCHVVSHLAQESLATKQMPRTITICLSAPPGDGLRAAREHFHEYIKPILVAGALDWEVIEGRREGEVRAGLAAKIRRLRKTSGEEGAVEELAENVEDRLADFRREAGIRRWDGVQGDLILGRHTWKEYVRGLHEGWLGPLDDPSELEAPSSDKTSEVGIQPSQENTSAPASLPSAEDSQSLEPPSDSESSGEAPSKPSLPPEKPPDKSTSRPSPTPPYISSNAYSTASLSPSTPSSFQPSTVVPLPHLLGFLNTPIRMYRFLTRRFLADETGQLVATLVLESSTRSYNRGEEFFSNAQPDDDASASLQMADVVEAQTEWEQERVLADEEHEWRKSARAPNGDDDPGRERPWKEKMVIDERIGTRMRTFDIAPEERSQRLDDAEARMKVEDIRRQGLLQKLSIWTGLRDDSDENRVKGWEMGLVGEEED